MGEKWVNYTFRKYQFFLMNPKKKIQEKPECNIRVNKFRKSFFLVNGSLEDLTGTFRKLKETYHSTAETRIVVFLCY